MGPLAGHAAAVVLGGSIGVGASAREAAPSAKTGLWRNRLRIGVYLLLWYTFSIAYNIYFKRALNVYPFPWACALFQMAFGLFVFGPLWALGIRKVMAWP